MFAIFMGVCVFFANMLVSSVLNLILLNTFSVLLFALPFCRVVVFHDSTVFEPLLG